MFKEAETDVAAAASAIPAATEVTTTTTAAAGDELTKPAEATVTEGDAAPVEEFDFGKKKTKKNKVKIDEGQNVEIEVHLF